MVGELVISGSVEHSFCLLLKRSFSLAIRCRQKIPNSSTYVPQMHSLLNGCIQTDIALFPRRTGNEGAFDHGIHGVLYRRQLLQAGGKTWDQANTQREIYLVYEDELALMLRARETKVCHGATRGHLLATGHRSMSNPHQGFHPTRTDMKTRPRWQWLDRFLRLSR